MERKNPEINDLLVEIGNLIERQLHDGIQNHFEIVKKFKEGKELIDELEEEDEKQHSFFRYTYHAKYADYFKKRGDVENARKQKNLLKRYEKFIYKTESILFTNAKLKDVCETSEPNEKHIKEIVEEELEKIQNILEDHIIETFRLSFNQLFNEKPETFLYYQNIIKLEVHLRRLADNPITEELINPETLSTEESEEKSEESKSRAEKIKINREILFSSLYNLKKLARKIAYLKRIDFIQHVLNLPNIKNILFSGILFTDEGINKRFRELSHCFHPDRTNQPNTPYWLNEKHKSLGDELFKVIGKFKETLLADLEEVSRIEGYLGFHEKKANNLWRISIDYRNAAKEQWNKLKLLKKDDIKNFSPKDLESFSINHGELAYHEYREACKIADKAKRLKKQVELRGNMALCLYVSKKFIEAQLYALSAIHLQLRNSQKITHEDMISAKKIFDKVKGGGTNEENFKQNTEIKLEDNFSNTLALVKVESQEISIFDRRTIQHSIEETITELVDLILPNRSLVRYCAPEEEILRAKERASDHMFVGGLTVAGATTLGVIAIGSFLTGGLITAGLGIWGGMRLWKKGTLLLKEPKIREDLNIMMTKAIKAYDKGEYQEFFKILSEEYKKDTCLLNYKKVGDVIDPKVIIKSLLSHGFRSDGIAYLLNLLGVVLGSRKIEIEGMINEDLKKTAIDVFRGVLNEELETAAKELDERVNESREYNRVRTFATVVIDVILNRDHGDIVQEYIDDAQEMPFQSRLEEVRNIAKLNLAIFDILNAGTQSNTRALKTIGEIRESINQNYQFFDMVKQHLEAIDDLLWIVSGNGQSEEPLRITL